MILSNISIREFSAKTLATSATLATLHNTFNLLLSTVFDCNLIQSHHFERATRDDSGEYRILKNH